jgi:hypothetical protein
VTLGQKAAMANLAFGYHLNANSNDFAGGLVQNGTDYNITYDAANGILGPAASFNGTTSRILLGSGDLNTPMTNGTWTVVCVFRPVTGWSSFPIISRGLVSTAGPTYYGIDLGITPTGGMSISRNIGSSTNFSAVSGNYTFVDNQLYLLGCSYNKTNGAVVFYIYKIRSGGLSLIATGTVSQTVSVAFHSSYDQGYNLGARLRNVSNLYGKGILGEVLIFSDVRTAAWFRSYALQLKGMLDLD